MSNNDSKDEDINKLIEEINSDDSKESKKKQSIITKKEGYDEYYEDTRDKLPEGDDTGW